MRCLSAILRAAIILREGLDDRAPLAVAFIIRAGALRALKICLRARDVGAQLLDLVVQRRALFGPAGAGKHLEKGRGVAALLARLLRVTIEFGLLASDRLFQTAGLFRSGRVACGTVDIGELRLEPATGLVTRRDRLPGRRILLLGLRRGPKYGAGADEDGKALLARI